MDEYPPLHWTSEGVCGDGDPDPPVEAAEEDEPQAEASPVGGNDYGGDAEEDPSRWQRRLKAERRARLKAEVDGILRELRTPLRDVVRDRVLPRLPVQSLLRFSSVSADWRRLVSVPIFQHTQSHAHRSSSGVFRQLFLGVPAYSPFDPLAGGVPDPSLAFLPGHPDVAALASSNGLLCCAGVLHSYYVCNPSTTEWTPLPAPPPPRLAYRGGAPVVDDGRTAVALVFEPSAANLAVDYHLVRAVEVTGDCEGVYGFQVFSSGAGTWWVSSDLCAAERLIHGSGVSAGGVAYWRTTMQTVVAYDPAADRCRSVAWPMGYDTTAQWQLGEMDGRLCCACVTDSAVKVYALTTGDQWYLLASYTVVQEDQGEKDGEEIGGSPPVFRSRPWPLRFQSGDSEVLLWVAGRVVGLDVASGRLRVACVAPEEPWMNPYADYVPHISTFARVFPKGSC